MTLSHLLTNNNDDDDEDDDDDDLCRFEDNFNDCYCLYSQHGQNAFVWKDASL